MRRLAIPLFAVVLAALALAPAAAGRPRPRGREVGPMVGFRRYESSYTIAVADVNGDGWDDVLIGHHGSRPAAPFLNQPLHGRAVGFEGWFRRGCPDPGP